MDVEGAMAMTQCLVTMSYSEISKLLDVRLLERDIVNTSISRRVTIVAWCHNCDMGVSQL